jgi:phosphoglycerate dehydrogenase-like enzyme
MYPLTHGSSSATPPNPTTIKLINRPVIEVLPQGAVFVLVSRMAVDVDEPEPPPADKPLRHLPNVIHTSHRAGNTRGAHAGVLLGQCEEARRFFAGEPLKYPLRPELVRLFGAVAVSR